MQNGWPRESVVIQRSPIGTAGLAPLGAGALWRTPSSAELDCLFGEPPGPRDTVVFHCSARRAVAGSTFVARWTGAKAASAATKATAGGTATKVVTSNGVTPKSMACM
jgi:hypothetical protein